MKRFIPKILSFYVLFVCLGFTACFQPSSLEDLLREAGDVPRGGDPGNGVMVLGDAGSPKLEQVVGTDISALEHGDTVTISLTTAPIVVTIRVSNADDFDIERFVWRHPSGVLSTGTNSYTVYPSDPSTAGSPFGSIAEHNLSLEAFGNNGRPYSTFITIKVVD